MTRDQAFALAKEIDETNGWKFFSVEPRPDGRYLVKAIFGGSNGETFHSQQDFHDSPFHKVSLAQLAKPNGNEIAVLNGGKKRERS